MPSRTIVLGTRASNLALTQTHWVARELQRRDPDLHVEILPITTAGDRLSAVKQQARSISELNDSGVGMFVKELEAALLSGEIDVAIHSLKDLPAKLPEGLTIGAIPQREDPRDALIFPTGHEASPTWEETVSRLPRNARIGSGSLRRHAQFVLHRPDLQAVPIRGNVETRLARLDEGRCDLLLLAAAGLRRLNLGHRISSLIPLQVMVPAPGQGALAVECRSDDETTLTLLRHIDQPRLRAAVWAERAFMETTEAGCRLPVGALAHPNAETPDALSHTLLGFFAESVGESANSWLCVSGSLQVSVINQSPEVTLQTYATAGQQLALTLREQLAKGLGRQVEIDG